MTVAQIQSLIGTKIKLVSSTLKSIGEIVTFSKIGFHKVPYKLSISVWPPLVAWHTSRRFSVYRQVLGSVSVATHPTALTILSRNSFTFCSLSRQATHFTNPQKKNYSGDKSGKDVAREWSLISYPAFKKFPVQRGTNRTGQVWCRPIVQGNYSPRDMTQNSVPSILALSDACPKASPVPFASGSPD